jgi:hypothetical protein
LSGREKDLNDADLNLQYLDATVRCVDAPCGQCYRATLDAGQDPQDRFRGLYFLNKEAQRLSGASRRAPEPAGDPRRPAPGTASG